MTDSRRQLAATLGRIYPYRAAKQQAPGVAAAGAKGFPNRSGMTNRSGTMDSRRRLAATLGRIYPYRAAKQQAPGVAATGAKGFPNRSGMTNMSGMTEGETGMKNR